MVLRENQVESELLKVPDYAMIAEIKLYSYGYEDQLTESFGLVILTLRSSGFSLIGPKDRKQPRAHVNLQKNCHVTPRHNPLASRDFFYHKAYWVVPTD